MDDSQRSPEQGNVQRPSAEMPLGASALKWGTSKYIDFNLYLCYNIVEVN